MATRTISTTGGNWNATAAWVEGAVPTAADDVVATATSGSITVNVASVCRSLDLTNYAPARTFTLNANLTVGTTTRNAGNVLLRFPATLVCAGTGTAQLLLADAVTTTPALIDCRDVMIVGTFVINTTSGSVKLTSGVRASVTVGVGNGVDLNNQPLSAATVQIYGAGTKHLTASTIYASTRVWFAGNQPTNVMHCDTATLLAPLIQYGPSQGAGFLDQATLICTRWQRDATAATLDPGTSTVKVTGDPASITGTNRFYNLTIDDPAVVTFPTGTTTVTHELRADCQHNACTLIGPATIDLGTTGTTYLREAGFRDVTITGNAAPVSGIDLIDLGGNSGIIFGPPPWLGTEGGASSPAWQRDGQVHLYVAMAIAAGNPWTMGPHEFDKLDDGNVLSRPTPHTPSHPMAPGTAVPVDGQNGPPAPTEGRLWVDLTCDVLSVETTLGTSQVDTVQPHAEAGTARIVLADPDRIYDPLNANSPWQYEGVSRLEPGTPIIVWAECQAPQQAVASSQVDSYRLFTGTVDSWSEQWTPDATKRQAVVIASDLVKDLVALDHGEQPPQGEFESMGGRLERIFTHYNVEPEHWVDVPRATNVVTLAATTLAQSAWELANRAVDDEIGYLWVDATNNLHARDRPSWVNGPTGTRKPLGCWSGQPDADVIVAAEVAANDGAMRNAIYAARTGGTTQVARHDESIARYGEMSYKRTDLGLHDDTDTAGWASTILAAHALPQFTIRTITMVPGPRDQLGAVLAGVPTMADQVIDLRWRPPGSTDEYHVQTRWFGVDHSITRSAWTVTYHLGPPIVVGPTWHLGPHADDRLDDLRVLAAFVTTP